MSEEEKHIVIFMLLCRGVKPAQIKAEIGASFSTIRQVKERGQ